MKSIVVCVLMLIIVVSCRVDKKKDLWIISSPAGEQFTHIDKTGTSVIPNGRLLTPAGKSIVVAPHPFG